MTTSRSSVTSEPRGEMLLGLMVLGVVSLTGLIALMSLSGTWLGFGAAIGGLVITTGGVMVAVGRLLSRTGDEQLDRVVLAEPERRTAPVNLRITGPAAALPTRA